MKKYISVIALLALLFGGANLKAEDLLPSDVYYKENIAVNKITVEAPTIRDAGDPGEEGPGGEGEGTGGQVNAPIGDAIAPLILASLLYAGFLVRRSKSVVK